MHEQAPPHYHRQGLKGSSHIMAVVRVAGEQRTQVEQGGRMLAKERASGACHMCQRSGCAAGAGTAHGAEPSIAHDNIYNFGLWAAPFKTSTSGPEILGGSLFSTLVVSFGCFCCSTTSNNQNKQPALWKRKANIQKALQ